VRCKRLPGCDALPRGRSPALTPRRAVLHCRPSDIPVLRLFKVASKCRASGLRVLTQLKAGDKATEVFVSGARLHEQRQPGRFDRMQMRQIRGGPQPLPHVGDGYLCADVALSPRASALPVEARRTVYAITEPPAFLRAELTLRPQLIEYNDV